MCTEQSSFSLIECSAGPGLAFLAEKNCRGTLVGLFHHGWYLDFCGRIVMLCNSAYKALFFSAELPDFEGKFLYNKEWENTEVFSEDGFLFIPAAGLKIKLCMQPASERAEPVNPAELCPVICGALSEGSGVLRLLALNESDSENAYFEAFNQSVDNFTDAFEKGDVLGLKEALKRLLGLGPGLTPSMDDWLCGFIYAAERFCVKPELCKTIKELVIELAPHYTNRISCAYLESVMRGEYFGLLEDLICKKDARSLLAVGSSSGCDMLCGVYYLLKNIKINGEVLSE